MTKPIRGEHRLDLGPIGWKTLAPDGTPCTGTTRGLLRRAGITAGELVPVGKETDPRWEQGEDPSVLDSEIQVCEKHRKMVVASPEEIAIWSEIGVRKLMRRSGLSQVYRILQGKFVRQQTLSTFKVAVIQQHNILL